MLSEKIISWYLKNKRSLPWRETKNPYFIWLSEVILQQTRVDQGLPYYLKFIEDFPTVEDLASADQGDVLRVWQGLGYYSRARNLQTAAQYIVNDLNGVFPKDYSSLLKMKGVGVYTAAAIASIAYNEPKAVVDGNVYRVLSRMFVVSDPINETAGIKKFSLLADSLISKDKPADYNQGLMELGATVCKPKNPACHLCPVSLNCEAFKVKRQLDFPVKTKKTKVRSRYFNYLAINFGNEYYLCKREGKGIWQGLYEFLHIETEKETKHFDKLENQFPEWLGRKFRVGEPIVATQVLSHQKIFATFWPISLNKRIASQVFYSIDELEYLPKHRLIERYFEDEIKLN